jgi:hypothetical protein
MAAQLTSNCGRPSAVNLTAHIPVPKVAPAIWKPLFKQLSCLCCNNLLMHCQMRPNTARFKVCGKTSYSVLYTIQVGMDSWLAPCSVCNVTSRTNTVVVIGLSADQHSQPVNPTLLISSSIRLCEQHVLYVRAEELKSCHFSPPYLTGNVYSNRTYTEWQRLSKTISHPEEKFAHLAFTQIACFIRFDIL